MRRKEMNRSWTFRASGIVGETGEDVSALDVEAEGRKIFIFESLQLDHHDEKNIESNQALDTTRASRPELWRQQGTNNLYSFSTGL